MDVQLFVIVIFCPFVLSYVEQDWAFNVALGTKIELECNDSRVLLQHRESLMWKTPDGKLLERPFNQSDYEILGDQGEILVVKSVTMANQGLYTCIINNGPNNARSYLLRGINLSGPLYDSLNEKYRENIIVAVISSAVFAVPMIGLCALEKFRYRAPGTKAKKEQAYILPSYPEKKTAPEVVVTAYDNPAADFSTQL